MDSSEADDENKNDGKTLLYVFGRGYGAQMPKLCRLLNLACANTRQLIPIDLIWISQHLMW